MKMTSFGVLRIDGAQFPDNRVDVLPRPFACDAVRPRCSRLTWRNTGAVVRRDAWVVGSRAINAYAPPLSVPVTIATTGATMDELDISPSYLHLLILKARAVMVKEGVVTPDAGGNPTDDELPETLQDAPEDMTREELIEEIEGLNAEQQNALVALMWLGRGDAAPEEWGNLVELAEARHETPSARYLLDHPLVADYWAEGLDRLGYGTLLD